MCPPAASGLLLNRYCLDGIIGEGSLGTVYRAYDTRLGRTIAIKTLSRELAATQPGHFNVLKERFAREAEAGARIGDHPNLVEAYDLFEDADGTPHLVLEYASGGNLAERIARGSAPLADALRLTRDAARGLQAAHERGLVHCDIKPANIYLAADGRAQVGDFGSAHIEDASGDAATPPSFERTPFYMSPEQRHPTEPPHPATDQYSLGLVFAEMLTGRMYKGMGGEEADDLLAEQPERVAALIRRMTADRQEDRFDTMADVVREIDRITEQLAA